MKRLELCRYFVRVRIAIMLDICFEFSVRSRAFLVERTTYQLYHKAGYQQSDRRSINRGAIRSWRGNRPENGWALGP